MTLYELRNYILLTNDEIYYEARIAQLELMQNEKVAYYQSPQLTGTPSGSGITSPTERLALISVEYSARIELQIEEARDKLTECRRRLAAIDAFIESVPDTETRSMLRRHIKQRASYNQIAREFFVSRNYVAKRIKAVCDE